MTLPSAKDTNFTATEAYRRALTERIEDLTLLIENGAKGALFDIISNHPAIPTQKELAKDFNVKISADDYAAMMETSKDTQDMGTFLLRSDFLAQAKPLSPKQLSAIAKAHGITMEELNDFLKEGPAERKKEKSDLDRRLEDLNTMEVMVLRAIRDKNVDEMKMLKEEVCFTRENR